MKVRLNGWERLWVILSFVYLLLVVGVTILFWPTPEGMWHRDEFIAMLPADLRVGVEAAYTSRWKWEEEWKRNVSPPDARRPLTGLEKIDRDLALTPYNANPAPKPSPWPKGFTLFSEPVIFPNGSVLEIRVAKDGDTQHDVRVAVAYWAVIESATRTERWTRLWQMALVWLIPCVVLYASGWAIAWVRRGFAKA
jgi:hypothetical protein